MWKWAVQRPDPQKWTADAQYKSLSCLLIRIIDKKYQRKKRTGSGDECFLRGSQRIRKNNTHTVLSIACSL